VYGSCVAVRVEDHASDRKRTVAGQRVNVECVFGASFDTCAALPSCQTAPSSTVGAGAGGARKQEDHRIPLTKNFPTASSAAGTSSKSDDPERVQIAEVQNVAHTSKTSMSSSVYVCFLRMPKDRMIRTAAP
jgi:hypothetical protein